MKTYQVIAQTLQAIENCRQSGNQEWLDRHEERLHDILEDFPSGSGFDNGTKLDEDRSTPNRLIFTTAFHHMNEGGMYDGWTDHEVIVTPDLAFGFVLRITGRDRNQIKDYIGEMFHYCLSADVAE